MQNYNLKAMKNQAGMTLIELTVVLLVLIGLAGLTLPYVGSFIGKTHNATSADTGNSLFSALQSYVVQTNNIPANLNLLTVNGGATKANVLDNSFVGGGTTYSTNFAANTADLSNILSSLAAANVSNFAALSSGVVASTDNGDGTYSNVAVNGVTFTPEVTGATPLAFVTDSGGGGNYNAVSYPGGQNTSISGVLGYVVPNGHKLIVLGVGAVNSAVGKTLASVPVHFGDKGSLQPNYTYSRFLAAVDVDTTKGVTPAKIVGIVHAPDTTDKWESLYSSIAGYYAN